jgi:hypothetical protein
VKKYGVWVKKNFLGKKYMGTERTTFVIDPEGRIEKIFPKVKSNEHVDLYGNPWATKILVKRNWPGMQIKTRQDTEKMIGALSFSAAIVGALIGAVVLFFGRKLFWLCVAAVGFAGGVEIASHLVHEPSPLLALAIALVLGLIGALLALFLQKVAIAVLGFLAGGKLAGAIAAAFFVHYAQYSTFIFVIGGLIGAVLLLVLFDWALIVVSALIGAHLIQSTIVLPSSGSTIVFIGLAIIGILVQAASFRRSEL